MRFLILVKATKESEAGMPEETEDFAPGAAVEQFRRLGLDSNR